MPMIYVRTKPGRVARESPKGRFIPTDDFVGVTLTPYVNRLINHHGDIDVRDTASKSPTPPPQAKPDSKSSGKDD